jgi:transcription termination factor Rho
VPTSGKILSGGVDSNALHRPKRFFGAARNIEEGGSLTIWQQPWLKRAAGWTRLFLRSSREPATAKSIWTANLPNGVFFPAIDANKAGTRREELLLEEEELQKLWVLRKFISTMSSTEIMELLIDKMKATKNNKAFFRAMNS